MLRRTLAAAVLALAVTACNEKPGDPKNPIPVGAQLVRGLGDVRVLDARFVPTGESSTSLSGTQVAYVIARVELTNDFGYDATPNIASFVLQDSLGRRIYGQDSGSAALIGISNSIEPLKKDDKRVYTVGFRVFDLTTTGTIEYSR